MTTHSGLIPMRSPVSAATSHANSMIEPLSALRIARSTSSVVPSTRKRSPPRMVISVVAAGRDDAMVSWLPHYARHGVGASSDEKVAESGLRSGQQTNEPTISMMSLGSPAFSPVAYYWTASSTLNE
jgi:hypothetical protein